MSSAFPSPKPTPPVLFSCSSADMVAQLCELEATVATVNTRLEQLMRLNDRLVEEKGQLKAQVRVCMHAEFHSRWLQWRRWWGPMEQIHVQIAFSQGQGLKDQQPQPRHPPLPAPQVRDLQLRFHSANQAADSSKTRVAAVLQERAELVQQAQALAAQLVERDASLQALAKTNGELRCAGGRWCDCSTAKALLGTGQVNLRVNIAEPSKLHSPCIACIAATNWRSSPA